MCKFKWIDSYHFSVNHIFVKCKYYINVDQISYVSLFDDIEINGKKNSLSEFCTLHLRDTNIVVKLSDFDKLITDLASYSIYNDLFLGGMHE